MTPLSAIAMVGITPAEAGSASGLFNMMRNLGGAIGTALLETFFTKREQYHSFIINAACLVRWIPRPSRGWRRCSSISWRMACRIPPAPCISAMIAVGATIRAQATLMGYADCFGLLGAVLVCSVASVFMLRKGAAATGGAH